MSELEEKGAQKDAANQKERMIAMIALLVIGIVVIRFIIYLGAFHVARIAALDRNLQKYLEQGNQELERQNYDMAKVNFQTAMAADPKNEEVYIGLAEAYIGQKDIESAKDILETGIREIGGEIRRHEDGTIEIIGCSEAMNEAYQRVMAEYDLAGGSDTPESAGVLQTDFNNEPFIGLDIQLAESSNELNDVTPIERDDFPGDLPAEFEDVCIRVNGLDVMAKMDPVKEYFYFYGRTDSGVEGWYLYDKVIKGYIHCNDFKEIYDTAGTQNTSELQYLPSGYRLVEITVNGSQVPAWADETNTYFVFQMDEADGWNLYDRVTGGYIRYQNKIW